jgi:hypothetical protein
MTYLLLKIRTKAKKTYLQLSLRDIEKTEEIPFSPRLSPKHSGDHSKNAVSIYEKTMKLM